MVRFNWLSLFAVALVAAVLSFAILISSFFDIGGIAYLFVGVPIISLLAAIAVLVVAMRKKRTPSFALILCFPVYWLVSWILFANSTVLREHTRWLLAARSYKAQLLAQPAPLSGELRHMEWDGWGWAGMDTEVYLVFDPADSLAVAARSHSAGKFTGVPCPVSRVRRLEADWYSVQFYTDASWGQCS
jgi:hypothetical protein